MAIICVRAEAPHEQVLRETGNLYILERILASVQGDTNFALLNGIDPYGDTVFNARQLQCGLLAEWAALWARASSQEERVALAAVRELAEFCLEQPHRYLRFFGD